MLLIQLFIYIKNIFNFIDFLYILYYYVFTYKCKFQGLKEVAMKNLALGSLISASIMVVGCSSTSVDTTRDLTTHTKNYDYNDISMFDIIKRDYNVIDTHHKVDAFDTMDVYSNDGDVRTLLPKIKDANQNIVIVDVSKPKVITGDLVEVNLDNVGKVKFHLAGVRSINSNPKYSVKSVEHLSQCLSKSDHVTLIYDKSKSVLIDGELVGKVVSGKVDCNFSQLLSGNAYFDKRSANALFDYEIPVFLVAESKAREIKTGVWD